LRFFIDPNRIQEIIVGCTLTGIVKAWNKAGELITGFTWEQVRGRNVETLFNAESADPLNRMLGLNATGTILPAVALNLRSNFGMEIPVEVTCTHRVGFGVEGGFTLLMRDVTLRNQLQGELDRMDVLYRSLVQDSSVIIYLLDTEGKILFINDRAEHLLGYSKEDLIGRELLDLVHPEDKERAYWGIRERRKPPRSTQNLEARLLTKQGDVRRFDLDFIYVSLNSSGIYVPRASDKDRSERNIGTQGIAQDITELKVLRDFTAKVESILPICSVCRRIRVKDGTRDSWVPLESLISSKSSTRFSHTFCPDCVPSRP
jgi:PAS domain S-box-containing protein